MGDPMETGCIGCIGDQGTNKQLLLADSYSHLTSSIFSLFAIHRLHVSSTGREERRGVWWSLLVGGETTKGQTETKQQNGQQREREGQKINSNVLHSVCVLSVEVSSDLRLQERGVRWIQSPANETILELLKPSYFVSKRLKSNKIVWR